MQMWNRFAPIQSIIDHQTIAILRQASLFGDFSRFEKQMSQDFSVLGPGRRDPGNRSFRENQKMRGCLRVYISNPKNQFIFINNRGRNFAGGYFFK